MSLREIFHRKCIRFNMLVAAPEGMRFTTSVKTPVRVPRRIFDNNVYFIFPSF